MWKIIVYACFLLSNFDFSKNILTTVRYVSGIQNPGKHECSCFIGTDIYLLYVTKRQPSGSLCGKVSQLQTEDIASVIGFSHVYSSVARCDGILICLNCLWMKKKYTDVNKYRYFIWYFALLVRHWQEALEQLHFKNIQKFNIWT